MRRQIWPVVVFLVATALVSAGVGWWAYNTAIGRLSARGQTELTLAADRLQSYLQRFRQLAVVLADHPGLIALLSEDSDQFVARAGSLLLETADKTGALEVFVLSANGVRVASSDPDAMPRDFSRQPYFGRAMQAALGTAEMQRGERDGTRVFYSAAPIQPEGRRPIGAVVVKVDVEAVETDWRPNPNILFFTDRSGVVFVANRFEMLLRSQQDPASLAADPAIAQKYDMGLIRAFPVFDQRLEGQHEVWKFLGETRLPRRALHLAKDLPVIGLRAEILLDAAPARLSAWLQAAFAAASLLVIGAVLLILSQRRMALAERLALERHAKAELEAQVARRTEQLSGVNLDLRQQIGERIEAEAALKRAQEDLVQAGKLSALGRMSAGISHELNQPLMAIRSFAENAALYLERDERAAAERNLGRISEMAARMARIIRNLRAFARKEGEPMGNVDLDAVVLTSLELSEKLLQDAGVTVDYTPPGQPVMVRGGEVRLQQVVVNLLTNAADAMEGQPERRIAITVELGADTVALVVRDTGPGLKDTERIFDPFYTTKAVGRDEGMGLGLSISYGIVQSFGGRISGRNHPAGGAVFRVELSPAELEDAA